MYLINVRYCVVYSVLDTFFGCFLLLLFLLPLFRFILDALWATILPLCLVFYEWSPSHLFPPNNSNTFYFLGLVGPGILLLLLCFDCQNNVLPYFLSPMFTETSFPWPNRQWTVLWEWPCTILISTFYTFMKCSSRNRLKIQVYSITKPRTLSRREFIRILLFSCSNTSRK